MAENGVQVFVGPANQLELGDVVTGPASVELETVSDRLQRLHLSIPSPTQELVDAQTASATAAGNSATSAADAATAAAAAVAEANGAKTAAAASASSASAAATTAQTAQTNAAASATSAAAAVTAAAAAAAPTQEQLNAIVQQKLLVSNLALDTDGVPFISPGSNSVFVYADTDGRPYFVS